MTPWTVACPAPLSSTISQSLLRFMSIELVMLSSAVPISSCLQFFPASGSFPISQLFASDGQCIGASALARVLPVNIQHWFPLRLTDLISSQSKELSRVFSSSSIWKHQFFRAQPSLSTKVLLPSVFFLGVGWGGGVKNEKIVAPTSQSYWGDEMGHLLIQVTKCLSIHYAFNFYNFQESN